MSEKMEESKSAGPNNPSEENLIDVERVIGSKNPRLLKWLPGFIIRYLKRILHQNDINAFIRENGHLKGLDFANRIIELFGTRIEVVGLENVPAEGRYLISANHPLGGLDGIALITVLGRLRKDILFPVNDLLMNVESLRPLFIPVNKHGSNAENIMLFDNVFKSDVAILYFPAGLCSRKQKHGVICDLEWKKTFISKARKFDRDIIPAHISGSNTPFFYNLARFRKQLGLKANIEMLYLVDEMYRQKGKTIKITFGKPIPVETFDRSRNDNEWASLMKEHVYLLEKDAGAVFNAKP